MARAPNGNVEKAYQMFKDGMKLVEIANQLNVPDGTVRRWKSTYKWDDEQSERSEKKLKKKNERSVKEKKAVSKEVKQVLENPDLTEKQRLFCLYYNKSFNATQSYLKAYGCSYDVANAEGYKLLVKPCVREEVMRLKKLKAASIMISEDDIVEKYMKIAFADMNDFIEFGEVAVPVVVDGTPIVIDDVPLMTKDNILTFKSSANVDGSLICEISHGRNGSKVKLEDRQKALDWLSKYFMMDPMSKHKVDYDNKRLELEKLKANTDNNDKTINIIHNIPRPKKGGEE